jgi:putative multiple sugar transport system ATP-binding protein
MNEGKMVGEMKASEATQESIMSVILQSGRGA